MAIRRIRAAEQGFTLLEMLVALSVFALAALALIRLQAYSLRSAADIEARTLAHLAAQNRAVELLTDPVPPPLGTDRGTSVNGGRELGWTQEVRMTGDARLIRIDIAVAAAGGAPAMLTVVRPAR